MKDLGKLLKYTRESKNLSLEQVSKDLKIRKSKLESIENGKLDEFDDTFYLKYFIRDYANYLGIDYDALIKSNKEFVIQNSSILDDENSDLKKNKFLGKIFNKDKKNTKIKTSKKRKKIRSGFNIFRFSPVSLLSISIFVILFLIWFVFGSLGSSLFKTDDNIYEGEDTTENEDNETNEEEKEEVQEPEEIIDTEIKFIENKDSTFVYEVSTLEEYKIEVIFVGGRSWLDIYDSKRNNYYGKTGSDGSNYTKTFTDSSLTFNIGAHQFVDIYINGILVEYEKNNENRYVMKINFNIGGN